MRLSQFLKAKLHHARVTHVEPEYMGSIAVDRTLMERAGLEDGELVHVWAVDHKARIQTYIFGAGPGVMGLNGGAAHFFTPGDRIIIAAFDLSDQPIKPIVLLLDEDNRLIREIEAFVEQLETTV